MLPVSDSGRSHDLVTSVHRASFYQTNVLYVFKRYID